MLINIQTTHFVLNDIATKKKKKIIKFKFNCDLYINYLNIFLIFAIYAMLKLDLCIIVYYYTVPNYTYCIQLIFIK